VVYLYLARLQVWVQGKGIAKGRSAEDVAAVAAQ